jgi:hypothetical protein
MTAPVSFREKVRFFSLAARAPSIHDPIRSKAGSKSRSAALDAVLSSDHKHSGTGGTAQ